MIPDTIRATLGQWQYSLPGAQRCRLTVAILVAATLSAPGWACDTPVGRLVSAEAPVDLRAAGQAGWSRIQAPHPLCEGDQLAVRAPGRAAVVLDNDVLVRLDQDTTLNLTRVAADADSSLGLTQGIAHIITRFRKRFEVITPFVNALVEGTEFTVFSGPGDARVVVTEGHVRAVNTAGERELLAGEGAEAIPGAPPGTIAVRPLYAVRWAIHYPLIVWFDEAARTALPAPWAAAVGRAQDAMRASRYAEALVALDTPRNDALPAQIAALRASILLALGRVDAAREHLDGLDRSDPSVLAVDAIIRSAANDPGAWAQAHQAADADPAAAPAQLALSYALQARRQVVEALAAAQAATRLAPGNPYAWARRAELELSLARSEEGRSSAHEALALAPALARARALLGFADLLGGRTDAARESFDEAVAADAADPLGHFGKGLAHVRAGDFGAGRREMEIAVLLDPSNAELRSYLGRIYVEEDRSRLGAEQFALARRLDPASPTPWHFDAFLQLRDNSPLEALADSERAIALNDNRAVFRSSELLDSDRAARTASLGAAYSEVGFDQAMLAAAMRALADDPLGPAGHRLLADAYAQTPRFESARVSEVFQAQVRQPIGQAPIPPQFQTRNPPIVEGPRALAPEEASALFERKPAQLSASLLAGNRSTRGDSLTASAADDTAQVSLGHFDYASDSLADTNDLRLAGTQLGLRYAPAPTALLYGDIAHTDLGGGDTTRHLVSSFLAPIRLDQNVTTQRGRLSLRHAPAVGEEFIVSAAAQDVREDTLDRFDALATDLALRTRVQARDLGLLYGRRSAAYGLTAGAGSYREARKLSLTSTTVIPFLGPVSVESSEHSHTEHNTAFGYLDLHPLAWARVHLGATYDALSFADAKPADRLSLKGGLTLALTPATNLRVALLQGVKGPKFQEQSLEPTQFAGFNQLFDDVDGTRWRRRAVGLDHRFAGGSSVGAEWSRRTLEVPAVGCLSEACLAGWSETLHRTYLALPLGARAAFSAAWQFESLRLKDDPASLVSLPFVTRTELLPLKLWLKPAARWTTQIEALRVRQAAAMIDGLGGTTAAWERFWLGNVRLSYVQPGRRLSVTLAINNLFDRRFAFQNTDLNGNPRVPLFYPERTVLVQANVRF